MLKNLRNLDPDPNAGGGGGGEPPAGDPPASDPTPVATEPGAAKATIPSSADPAVKPDPSFYEHVPAEYKDKPYLKDVQNFEQLFKKLDGAEELIGKRPAGIPAADASDEEKNKFYESWGRPEKAEDYTFVDVKLPEGMQRNDELTAFAKDLFHKAGLRQDQVDIIQGGYEGKMLELAAAAQGDPEKVAAEEDAQFEKMTDELFKDRKETVLKNGNLLLVENTPKELQDDVAKLDNKSLLIMSAVLDSVRAKYISEDVMPTEGDPTDQGASIDDLRNQARELMAKPEYSQKSHKDHQKIFDEVQSIYDRINRLEKLQQK